MSSEHTVAPPAADINDVLSKNIQEIKPSPIIESTQIAKDEKEPDEGKLSGKLHNSRDL